MRRCPIDNSNGRVTAMTLVSGMPRWKIVRQQLVFAVLKAFPWLSRGLVDLTVVHIGWWTLLSDIPDNGPPHPQQKLRSRYLIFESNFDDRWDSYIAAFGLKIPKNVNGMWRAAWTFPGARPTTDACRYVGDHQYEVDHYYAAYPEASTKMVVQALRLQERFAAFCDEAAHLDDDRFEAAYHRFVRASQGRPLSRDRSVQSEIRVFGSLAPIIPGDEPALRAHLRSLGDHSPFAGVTGIHFARWAVIPQLPYDGHPQKADVLPCQYLLFTVCADEEPLDDLLGRLRDRLGAGADAVWGHCVGYRGRHELPRYLRHNQLRPRFVYVQPPGGTVERIKAALDLHERLLAFVIDHQRGVDARTLRRDWEQFVNSGQVPVAVP